MAGTFQLTIDERIVVDELPDAWTDQKYLEIMERLDIPNAQGVPHEELLEICHVRKYSLGAPTAVLPNLIEERGAVETPYA